jgi:hypothetical protein
MDRQPGWAMGLDGRRPEGGMMSAIHRVVHHLLSAIFVAILLTVLSIQIFYLLLNAFEDSFGDHGIMLLFLVMPAAAIVGALAGLLGSWQLLKRYNVPRGGEWAWWRRDRPRWLQRLVIIAVVVTIIASMSLCFVSGP